MVGVKWCYLSGEHRLERPLLGGVELEQVEELWWLGYQLDRRLSFARHWSKMSCSLKAAMGALGRLVGLNKIGLRHLFQERVVSVMLHSLPFLPPTTAYSWARLRGVTSHTAHLLTNTWTCHGAEVIRMAGLDHPGYLAFKHGMRFMFECQAGRRRFGRWLTPQQLPRRVRQLRSEELRHGRELEVPRCQTSSLSKLQPVRLLEVWNRLPFREAGVEAEGAFASLAAFTAALPQLYAALPAHLRKSHFGED